MAENLQEKKKKSLIEREKEVTRRGDDLERLEEELKEGRRRWKDRQEPSAYSMTAKEGRSCLPVSNKIIVLLSTIHQYYQLVRYYRLFQNAFEFIDGKCFMKIHSEMVLPSLEQ